VIFQRRLTTLLYAIVFASILGGCGGGASPPVTATGNGVDDTAQLRTPKPSPTPTAKPTSKPVGTAQTPEMSDAFVDSAGVNIHLSYYGTLYGDDFSAIQSLLTTLGVRHVRDGEDAQNWSICGEDASLASAGIHFDVISPGSLSTTDLAWWMSCIGGAAETVEGPNEYDNSGDSNWIGDLRTFQQTLYGQYGAQMPVLAPALTSENAYTSVGSLSGMISRGNMHDYFAGRNPGTPGWGGTDGFGTYGSLAWNIAMAQAADGTAPITATETGYSEQTDPNPVSPATKADYTLRTLLEHWNAGVTRTYIYELVDEGGTPFSHFGLTDSSGNPKPAYTALKNVLAHLSDRGAAFTPTPLTYAFAGGSTTVQHTLLQKRNGTYELIVWNEAEEWDPNANVAITVAPSTATLSFGKAPSSIKRTTLNASGAAATTTLTSGTTVTFAVTTSPTILDISM
jgi:hypothetical protein